MRTGYWVGLLLACAMMATAQSVVPPTFNYQGVLRGGSGEMLNSGPKKVAFRLWDAATAGNLIWGREYTVQLDTNGLFNVELSDSGVALSASPNDSITNDLSGAVAYCSPIYLGLTVSGSDEIAPRQQLLSVPYAMMAGDVKSASAGFTVAGELNVRLGVKVTGSVEAESVIVGEPSKNVTLTANTAGVLEVPSLNVPGKATVATLTVPGNAKVDYLTVPGDATVSNLTVNGMTTLAGPVQAFTSQNIKSSASTNTFSTTEKNSQTNLTSAVTDGFIVLSVYWNFNVDGDDDVARAYGDFTFTRPGSDTRRVRCGQHINDMTADGFTHYEIITLPVRKGETVAFVPDTDPNNWKAEKHFTITMISTFVPFGVSQ